MSMSQLRRVLRSRTNMALLSGKHTCYSSPARMEHPNPYESDRVTDYTRFEDEPAPKEDDMISKIIVNILILLQRDSLFKASSSLWIQRLWRIPCR